MYIHIHTYILFVFGCLVYEFTYIHTGSTPTPRTVSVSIVVHTYDVCALHTVHTILCSNMYVRTVGTVHLTY
jgi:hypothetical protein